VVTEAQMKVWLVGDCGCEHYNVRYICISKTTALKRWEEIRQELIKESRGCLEKYEGDKMYERISKNLSEPNPELMNNYPHDQPFIEERETE
jgi:hypothetical protein